jgi:hypothetical protein
MVTMMVAMVVVMMMMSVVVPVVPVVPRGIVCSVARLGDARSPDGHRAGRSE